MQHYDYRSQLRELEVGQVLWARNLQGGPSWRRGVVQDKLGPWSYLVELDGGEMWRRHIDHLRIGMPDSKAAGVTSERNNSSLSSDWVFSQEDTLANPPVSPGNNTEPEEDSPATADSSTCPTVDQSENPPEGHSPPTRTTQEPPRYPTRVRHLPNRLYGNLERY